MEYLRQVWRHTPALRWFALVLALAAGLALATPSAAPDRPPSAITGWDRVRRWVPFLPGSRPPRPMLDEIQSAAGEAVSMSKELGADVVREAAELARDFRRPDSSPGTPP